MKKHIGWNHNVYGDWDDTEIDTWTWDITEPTIIYVLWGRRPDAEEWQTELLAECPTRSDAEAKQAIATRNGWQHCRISRMDLSVPPNFSDPKLINI